MAKGFSYLTAGIVSIEVYDIYPITDSLLFSLSLYLAIFPFELSLNFFFDYDRYPESLS